MFDQAIMEKLYARLAGTTTATYKDAYNAVKGSTSVLTSPAKDSLAYENRQEHSKNYSQIIGTTPFSLEFGGFTWNAVYATTNTTAGNNDLIVTLWMSDLAKDRTGTVITSSWGNFLDADTSAAFPSNMYSTSQIRAQALNAGDPNGGQTAYAVSKSSRTGTVPSADRLNSVFAPFTLSESAISKKSLTRFLATPSQLRYQEKENYAWAYASSGTPYLLPNEETGAVDTTLLHYPSGTGGWWSYNTTIDGQVCSDMNPVVNNSLYKEWINDTLWLPSIVETGFYGSTQGEYQPSTSLWGIPYDGSNGNDGNLLRTHTPVSGVNESLGIWLRSGNPEYATYACGLNYGSLIFTLPLNLVYGIRPALHLNLTEAALCTAGKKLANPTDLTTTYNGDTQTVKSIYDANNAAVSWYDTDWYNPADNYIEFTYIEKDGSNATSLKNGGEYWVKAKITAACDSKVDADVASEFSGTNITAAQLSAAQAIRRTKYGGTADTSDSAHAETDTERWFKITVKPKEITVNKPSYDANTGQFTAPTFANESELYADRPVLATHFTGQSSSGTQYDAIDTLPNLRGTFRAQAILIKSATDQTAPDNYVIKDATNCYCNVTISYARLAIIDVSAASKEYTGSALSFPLSAGYTSAWATNASLTLPTGVTLTGDDTNGWALEATEAGEYTITASINSDKTSDYCWDVADKTQTPTAPRDFKITVTKKKLTVDFTSSTGSFLFAVGDTGTLTAAPNNAVTGDDVKLTLTYALKPGTTRVPVPSGTLDVSGLSQGEYTLFAKLEDSAATDNKNYEIDGGEATQDFTVAAQDITLTGVDWQYSQNNGTPVAIAAGSGASAGTPYEVTYNGKAYVFGIVSVTLASQGVKLDMGYGSGGYQNSMQTNAMNNAVGVTVRLIPLNEQYKFKDASGNPLPDQYKDFTIYVKVNKANVDFSQVEWSADELEFNGTNQRVTIKAGFPSFLTPGYMHASPSTNVDNYTTKVDSVQVSDNAVAANYNIPSSVDLAGEPTLTHDWKIVKKRITVTWQAPIEQSEGGKVIFVPCVSDNSLGALEYVYYASDKTTEMTLSQIITESSDIQERHYWVCAKLKAAGSSGYNETNCELYEGTTDVSATGSFQRFTTGDNKTPVRVGLETDKVVYTGEELPAKVVLEGGSVLTENDFTVSYTMEDGSAIPSDKLGANNVPVGAGKYKAVIALDNGQTGSYAITGQCAFDYTIEKADYDISSMKWVDTLNNNAEYTSPYVWEYDGESDTHGKVHTLSFVGENIDGLTVKYSLDTEEKRTGSNAGSYQIKVQFDVADPDNYNAPEDIDFTWEITPFVPDLTEVKWNYDSAYVYKIVDGAAVEYEVHLENLPDGLSEIIDYTGDTGKYSNAGSHATSFAVNESKAMRKNFGELVFGAGVSRRLVWEIKSLTIEKPQQRQTETFRAEGYTFAEITNLPEDWAQYFDVTVTNLDGETIAPTDGTWTFTDVDRYSISIRFKQNMNTSSGGTADNVKWTDNGRAGTAVSLTINKLVFDVNGWIDQGENVKPNLDAEAVEEIEKYFDYVLKDESGAPVALNAALEFETVYTIALKLKAEYEGNVAVKYLEKEVEETTPYVFLTDVDPSVIFDPSEFTFYRKPTEQEANIEYRYTGEEVQFKLGNWFYEDAMRLLAATESDLKGTEEGTYQFRVGFKKGVLAAWESEDPEAIDRTPVTITFTISKDAKLSDRFILKDGITVPFVFLYDDFSSVGAIEDYAFDADKLAYISRLSLGDTLSALLSQFENGADITVYDLDGTTVITDYSTVVATGMYLRLMDGETMLNQLILSVLGEITGDGIINLKDKAQLNSYTLGTTKLAPAQLLASDITGDGIINLKDKAQLNSYTLGTNALPVTPITVPAASSVSEVVEEFEAFANGERSTVSAISSLSKITEEVPAHTTSAEVIKENYPHQSAKGAASFPLMCKGEAKRKEIF